MLTIKYDEGGVEKSLEVMADSFSDLGPVFGLFAKYKRKKVQGVFDSGGEGQWAPRAEANQQAYEQSKSARIAAIERDKYTSLLGALRHSQAKVKKLLAKTPASNSKLTARRQKSIETYNAKVAEVQRLGAGGPRTETGNKKLYERVGRREARAAEKIAAVESGQLLGKVANSFKIEWTKTSWTMASEISWAGAQQDGATVGHGAKLPARPFLYWVPEDLEEFARLANEHVLKAFEKGAGK